MQTRHFDISPFVSRCMAKGVSQRWFQIGMKVDVLRRDGVGLKGAAFEAALSELLHLVDPSRQARFSVRSSFGRGVFSVSLEELADGPAPEGLLSLALNKLIAREDRFLTTQLTLPPPQTHYFPFLIGVKVRSK